MQITKRSTCSGKEHTLEIPVTQDQLDGWKQSGKHIQDALPHLTPDEREFLISGCTAEEFDTMFADDEEES